MKEKNHYDYQKHLFRSKLESWTPLRKTRSCYFSESEMDVLDRSSQMTRNCRRTTVIVSFENRFAALGGLAAVIKQFPSSLRKRGENVVVVTPFHSASSAVREAIANGKLAVRFSKLPFKTCGYSAHVDCYEETDAEVTTLHLGIEGRFNAGDNPYGYSDQENLLYDSLAFCAAVPPVLSKCAITGCLLFHAHDWETAPIALFSHYAVLSGIIQGGKTVLTLHNSFDAPFPDTFKKQFLGKEPAGATVLQVMLPFINGPLVTVSGPFAYELRNDPLQREVFADHLQTFFAANPPLGIENGMFGKPEMPFSQKEIALAKEGNLTLLNEKKAKWRVDFIKQVKKEKDPRIIGTIDIATLEEDALPVLFMSGRLDFMQKGFDVVFQAIKRLAPKTVKLFFCPTLHNGNDDLSFFKSIAEECPGDIVIWPFRISGEQYRTFIRGSSFLLMPSLYEPFGSVSEGFLSGTPVIARATGGLISQVHPGPGFTLPPFYGELFRWRNSQKQNGILFREDVSYDDTQILKGWRDLLNTPPEKRTGFPLYTSMVEAAMDAIKKAADCFSDRQRYAEILLEGLFSVQAQTWDETAKKYREVFDVAQSRG